MQMHNDVLGATITSPHNRKSPSKSPNKSPHKAGSRTDLELQARRLKRVCTEGEERGRRHRGERVVDREESRGEQSGQ